MDNLDLITRLAYRLAQYHICDHPSLKEEGCAVCLVLWEVGQIKKEERQ